MFKQILFFVFILQLVSSQHVIFSNGKYDNNWYQYQSTCSSSTTGKYDNQFILYTQMNTDSILSLHCDIPVSLTSFSTFSFGLLWEDQFCNLRIAIELGNSQESLFEKVSFQPIVLQSSKWNRIVVNVTSLPFDSIDTIRIIKKDRKDSSLYFNDFILSSNDIQPGVYEYTISSSNSLHSENETSGCSSLSFVLLCIIISFFL